MGLKLNGATSGSIEIDVPAVAGTDTSITIPAKNGGTFIVEESTGNIDLGPLDINGSASDDSVNIDSSGRLLVGTSTAFSSVRNAYESEATPTRQTYVATATNSVNNGFGIYNFSSSGYAPNLDLCASKNNTVGSHTIVSSDQALGHINFGGSDGTQFRVGATILAAADGTPGASDMPGKLVFSTTADGASSPTERLRISSNGNIEASGQVQLTDGTAASPGLTFSSDGGADTGIFRPGANILGFTTDGTERMRIASGGYVEIGQVGSPSGAINSTGFRFNEGSGFWWSTTGQNSYWNVNTQTYFNFRYNANNSGAIVISNGSTSYNTSSDYRLKENVVDLDGAITRVKQLAPKRFNFIATPERTVDGFLAHEAQAIVPEAVTGIKDEVEVWTVDDTLPDGVSVGDNKLDEDGNTIPRYQGIDQAKLVPLLTAALQEAIGKIEALETANASQAATIAALDARLTALEGGAA